MPRIFLVDQCWRFRIRKYYVTTDTKIKMIQVWFNFYSKSVKIVKHFKIVLWTCYRESRGTLLLQFTVAMPTMFLLLFCHPGICRRKHLGGINMKTNHVSCSHQTRNMNEWKKQMQPSLDNLAFLAEGGSQWNLTCDMRLVWMLLILT